MIDEDRIIYTTDNDAFSYHSSRDDDDADGRISTVSKTKSNLGFDDCVKLNVFRKSQTATHWTRSFDRGVLPSDDSLLFLTQSNKLLDSFDLKLKFENIIAEKKKQESKDFKKKRFENVKAKLNENRNPNIKNLLKDIIATPTEESIKKLKNDYKKEFDSGFINNEMQKSFSSNSTHKILSRSSRKSSVIEKSVIFKEDSIREEKKQNATDVFLTENQDDDDQSTVISEEDPNIPKFESKSFELKYKHLLKDSDDSDEDNTDDNKSNSDAGTAKTSSTAELMKDETTPEIIPISSAKSSKRSSKKGASDLKLPIIVPPDPEIVAREMRLALFNGGVNPSESSLVELNTKLDDINSVHLPSFQPKFHQICQYGNDTRLVKLVTEDIDFDVNKKQNGLGRYCIHECCLNGNINMLKSLLPYVDDINKCDKNSHTAAHLCALHGELDCLKILAANSADLLLSDNHGMQLSHLAAKNNHRNIIEFLFQIGISLKATSKEGKLPVHYAAQCGSFEALKLLTEYYVDISQVDNDGNYAAHLACIHNRLQCLKYLIKIGTPLNTSVNKKGRTFLHVCALFNSVACLHWLLENGADPTVRDLDGNTLTHLACLGGSADAMNCLLQHDCSINVLNYKNETPMDLAKSVGKCLHIQKAITNDVRCAGCVKIAIKRRWEQEHEKTVAEKSIERNKNKYYELKRDEPNRSLVASGYSKGTRDLIAQYFGPTFQD